MSIHVSDKAFPVVTLSNALGEATVALFGGHVLSYTPARDQQPRLWVSEKAVLDGTKAIRGGMPVCWPWFSDAHGQPLGTLPSHGFVRNQMWRVVEEMSTESKDSIVLQPTSSVGPGFTANAQLRLSVTLGESLEVSLSTTNQDTQPFNLGCALHTYFAVDDINATQVVGLQGHYKDKTQDWAVLPTPSPYTFSGETDRVHMQAIPKVEIHSTIPNTIHVASEGHDSIVVWNPWSENAKTMDDMTDEGYQTMLCVETALTQGYELAPGETHTLTQIIR